MLQIIAFVGLLSSFLALIIVFFIMDAKDLIFNSKWNLALAILFLLMFFFGLLGALTATNGCGHC